jgi:hypothetical protein
LVKLILNIENNEFIKKVTDLINSEKADFWNELTAEQKAEIEKGLEELNTGERSSYKDVLKRIS